MKHYLKIIPEFFNAIISEKKKFEVRLNDRDYKVNDILYLKEFDAQTWEYTGRVCECLVSYIMTNCEFSYISDKYVIMSITLLPF